jgi:hypothetical protein
VYTSSGYMGFQIVLERAITDVISGTPDVKDVRTDYSHRMRACST